MTTSADTLILHPMSTSCVQVVIEALRGVRVEPSLESADASATPHGMLLAQSRVAPKRVFLEPHKLEPNLELFRHLSADVAQDADGWWVASDPRFLTYGDGPTEEAAIKALSEALAEFYSLAHECRFRTPSDMRLFTDLETHVRNTTRPQTRQ